MVMLINQKQRKLLMLSDSIKQKEFKGLYEFLRGNSFVSRRDAHLEEELKNITAYLEDLIKESQMEWKADRLNSIVDIGEKYHKKNVHCELCGKNPIRYQYRLKNLVNAKVLLIGSECIKEFGEAIRPLKVKSSSRKNGVASKIHTLENKIPGIKTYIDKGWRYPQITGKILPIDLESKWMDLYNTIKILYHNNVYESSNNFTRLLNKWKQVEPLKNQIDSYQPLHYTDNDEDNNFAVTKDIVKWITVNKKHKLYEMIQADQGKITARTIHLIEERNFMEKILKSLVSKIKKHNIILKKAYMKKKLVKIEIIGDYGSSLTGTISYQTFIKNCSDLIFNPTAHIDKQLFIRPLKLFEETKHNILNEFLSSHEAIKRIELNLLRLDEALFSIEPLIYLISISELSNQAKLNYLKNQRIKRNVMKQATIEIMNQRKYKLFKQVRE